MLKSNLSNRTSSWTSAEKTEAGNQVGMGDAVQPLLLWCSSSPHRVPTILQDWQGPVGPCASKALCWVLQQGVLWRGWPEMLRAFTSQYYYPLLDTLLPEFGAFNSTIVQEENSACGKCHPETVGKGSCWTCPWGDAEPSPSLGNWANSPSLDR